MREIMSQDKVRKPIVAKQGLTQPAQGCGEGTVAVQPGLHETLPQNLKKRIGAKIDCNSL